MKSLKPYQKLTEEALRNYLHSVSNHPPNLKQAIEYATLNQGKRMRPAMVFAIGEIFGIKPDQLKAPACALELIHCYSLVHDDLPAMDDDDLRRGQPTCHKAFSEATAILVGDAQQSLAFQILANASEIPSENRLQMIQLLSQAAGANGMVAGQQIDLNSENLPQPLNVSALENLHQLKTGALITSALLIGACQSETFESYRPVLKTLGEKIGLAFQVQDDILDIESDTETLGKTQGKDEQADKSTYPKLMGLAEAKRYRDQLIDDAKKALQQLPKRPKTANSQNPPQKNNAFLTELIEYVATRQH